MRSVSSAGNLFDAVSTLQRFVCVIENGVLPPVPLADMLPRLGNPADQAVLDGLLLKLALKLDHRGRALQLIRRLGVARAIDRLALERLGHAQLQLHRPYGGTRPGLADIAHERGYSADTLRRRVVNRTGAPPREVRRRERMAHALRLLRAGTKVVAAAHECGYRSERSFFAAFRELTGLTPAAARKLTEAEAAELLRRLLPWEASLEG